MSGPALRDVVRGILGLFVLVWVIAFGRAVRESHRYAALGDAARAADDWGSAAVHYRHAAQWYAPGLGAHDRAFDALIALGDARAAEADVEGALLCYRSARTAAMATRTLRVPHADALPALHEKIGALMARQGAAVDSGAARRFAAQLDAYPTRFPRPWRAAGASVAFLGWVVALLGAAVRGFTPDGAVARRALAAWAAASVALLALWIFLVRIA